MRAFRLPPLRKRLWQIVAGLSAGEIIAAGLVVVYLKPISPTALLALSFVAVFSLLILLTLALLIDRRICKPLVATTRGAEIVASSNPGHKIEIKQPHWLARLPETITQLGTAVARSRRELDEAASSWAARIEARKARLETILREIREGVIVCGHDGSIKLYNRTARELLAEEPALGLGRNINEVLNEGPLRHTLALLADNENESGPSDAELVCATASGERLLRCRLARLNTDDSETNGFVMTLQDVSVETRESLRREHALRYAVEALRNPLTSLGTATESLRLAQREGLAKEATGFADILQQESQRLSQLFESLSVETASMVAASWRLEDAHLGSLIASIRQSTDPESIPRIQCNADVWVSAEPYLLSQVIESILSRLREQLNVTAVAVSGREEGSLVYLDFNWSGDVVAPDQLDAWLDEGLTDVRDTVTLREVLQRHDTTAWSQPDLSRTGRALLRLPLPGAPDKTEVLTTVPARPEFYEVAIEEEERSLGEVGEKSLSALDFVVFDCETTGLEPSHGDEIVSIGAVRIHRGRVMHGETFELMANPGRDIPALATSIHGISNEDVIEAPPVEEVVRRFHAFAGEAVLVGFNIAFDLRFLKLKQRLCGVRFDQPTLDALLLSILLHDHTGEHTMESIAERLGVGVGGRHTALGDSLTTAEIFIRLLDLLPAESINTLADATAAQERMIEYRRQQHAF